MAAQGLDPQNPLWEWQQRPDPSQPRPGNAGTSHTGGTQGRNTKQSRDFLSIQSSRIHLLHNERRRFPLKQPLHPRPRQLEFQTKQFHLPALLSWECQAPPIPWEFQGEFPTPSRSHHGAFPAPSSTPNNAGGKLGSPGIWERQPCRRIPLLPYPHLFFKFFPTEFQLWSEAEEKEEGSFFPPTLKKSWKKKKSSFLKIFLSRLHPI